MYIPQFTKSAMALAVACASFSAFSDEDNAGDYSGKIDEEVLVKGELTRYSATKSNTPIVETSRSVTLETLQQLKDKGALDLADAYVYAAGVTGETYGFATRGDWVKVRGLDAPQYQDSLQSLFGFYNNARPHIYTLEQVEILKGPVSVLYGQGSPGGLVNIVTKRPQEEAKGEIVMDYGNNNYSQLAADFTGALDADAEWLYRLVAVKKDSDTQVDFVNNDALVIAPSISWRPTADTNITLLGNYTKSETKAGAQFLPISGTLLPGVNGQRIESSTFLGEPGFDRYNTKNKSLTLLADHQINDTWSVEATARKTSGESDYKQSWAHFIGRDLTGDGISDRTTLDGVNYARTFYIAPSSSDQKAADVRFKANFSTGAVDHNVMIGGQYQNVKLDTGRTAYLAALGFPGSGSEALGSTYWINVFNPVYGNVPPQSLIDQLSRDPAPTTTQDTGFYINDQISYQNWRFTVGLRRDKVENRKNTRVQKDSATSYSAGVLYQFENGLSPYINYAESFQPVVEDATSQRPKKPREGRQYEAGIKYQPEAFPGLITLAYFDLEESNLPNPLSLPGGSSQQQGVGHVDGVELEGVAAVGDFTVELNLSRINTKDPNGYRFASIPEKQASSWIGYKPVEGLLQGFKAGLGIRYMGSSYGGRDTVMTPSYTLGDLMLGYDTGNWDMSLNVRNVADKDYQASCLVRGDCFPGERRSVVGKVSYSF